MFIPRTSIVHIYFISKMAVANIPYSSLIVFRRVFSRWSATPPSSGTRCSTLPPTSPSAESSATCAQSAAESPLRSSPDRAKRRARKSNRASCTHRDDAPDWSPRSSSRQVNSLTFAWSASVVLSILTLLFIVIFPSYVFNLLLFLGKDLRPK